ncbi:MarR family winged helix-turn-helix transcriptional regulator [Streptomyces sp. NPDC055078]
MSTETPTPQRAEDTAPDGGIRAPLTVGRPELLPGGTDDDFRQLTHGLFALAARHDAVRAGHAAMVGLSGAQYTTLITVAHLATHGEVRVKDIAEHLWVTPTFATMEIKKLAAQGLVEKSRSTEDRRVQRITVTPEGMTRLRKLAPIQRQVNDRQFADLTAEEFRELNRLVRRLIATSDQALALQAFIATETPSVVEHGP